MSEQNTRNNTYKELAEQLKTGEDTEEAYKKINELCTSCRPASPLMCVELCQIWRLKREFHDTLEAIANKPRPIDVLNTVRDEKCLKILGVLNEKQYSLEELEQEFEGARSNQFGGYCINPLMEAGLIRKEDSLYEITTTGKNAYDLLTKSGIASLPVIGKEHEEEILEVLSSGPKSHDELLKALPNVPLSPTLEKLRRLGIIALSGPSGRVLYYKTKRRPTRKFSPTELKVFKALPKEGISASDLSKKVGISEGRVYRYLRLLRFKRHVRKAEAAEVYELTDAGRDLVESLNVAYSLIQS